MTLGPGDEDLIRVAALARERAYAPYSSYKVGAAIRTMYFGWLDDTARNFQTAAHKWPLPGRADLKDRLVAAEPGECLLFVDGLRFDVAQRLLARAHERQLLVTEGYRWAALPTVTARRRRS